MKLLMGPLEMNLKETKTETEVWSLKERRIRKMKLKGKTKKEEILDLLTFKILPWTDSIRTYFHYFNLT